MIIRNNYGDIVGEFENSKEVWIYNSVKKYFVITGEVRTFNVYRNSLLKINNQYYYSELIIMNFLKEVPELILENLVDITVLSRTYTQIAEYAQFIKDEKALTKKLKVVTSQITMGKFDFDDIIFYNRVVRLKLVSYAIAQIKKGN